MTPTHTILMFVAAFSIVVLVPWEKIIMQKFQKATLRIADLTKLPEYYIEIIRNKPQKDLKLSICINRKWREMYTHVTFSNTRELINRFEKDGVKYVNLYRKEYK